jgi:hypothetical protein
MTARIDIKKGEEITFDYSTSEANTTKNINECGCGENNCRKKLTSEDWKKKEVRELYKGHFHPHLQKLIDLEEKN